jgi:Integrase zinc binding domain
LEEYDDKIQYIQGKWNILADALSSRSDGQQTTFYTGEDEAEDNATIDRTVATLTMPNLLLGTVPQQEGYCVEAPRIAAITTTTLSLHKQVLADLTRDYLADPTYQEEYRIHQQLVKKDGLQFEKKGRLCVPDGSTRLVLMHDSRDAIVSGHLGVAKTIDRMSRNFTWPSTHAQVTAYVTTCDRCQRNKFPTQRPSGLLQPLEVPDEPWAHVSLDFVMALPHSNGFDAILVVVDKLSKSSVLIPLRRPSSPRKQPVFSSTVFIAVIA